MKILFLTPRFPYPLEKGDKLRAYHQILQLAQKAQVVLCSLSDKEASQQDLAQFEPKIKVYQLQLPKWKFPFRLFRSLWNNWPLQIGYFYEPSLKRKIAEICAKEQPDLIFCQLARAAEYVRDIKGVKVLDYMDALSINMERRAGQESWMLRPVFAREARLMKSYETNIFKDFDQAYIISNQDKAYFQFEGKEKIKVLPNGIDASYFYPMNIPIKYDLCFVGNMGYYPNVNAAIYLVEKIMPLVWAKRPETTVLIAGARPTQNIKKLATDKVFVSGWIDDIRQAYAASSVFCAPLFTGSGQQNKLLEAMSMAIPCVTTPLVNNAIEARKDEMVKLADSPESFAAAILVLLEDSVTAKKMGMEARAFVTTKYTWTNIEAVLEIK